MARQPEADTGAPADAASPAMLITYRVSPDWSYLERKARLARVYSWLLGLEEWPPDIEQQHEEARDG